MTSFILKIIALITMSFDHIGYIIFKRYSFMNIIGKISFPIFAFQITEGYKHTKSIKKYILRLFIFALISQFPFMLFLSTFTTQYYTLNIFFTLLLGLLAIIIFDKSNNKVLKWSFLILIMIIAQLLHCDYGCYGIAIIFIFYFFKENKILTNIFFIFITFIKYIYSYIMYGNIIYIYLFLGTCLSLIFINLYNGEKGKNIKYLLYIYYPIHLIILYLIHFVI